MKALTVSKKEATPRPEPTTTLVAVSKMDVATSVEKLTVITTVEPVGRRK